MMLKNSILYESYYLYNKRKEKQGFKNLDIMYRMFKIQ